jgi:hypothetical protein
MNKRLVLVLTAALLAVCTPALVSENETPAGQDAPQLSHPSLREGRVLLTSNKSSGLKLIVTSTSHSTGTNRSGNGAVLRTGAQLYTRQKKGQVLWIFY